MATYPRGDLILLATPARYDEEEKRVVPSAPMDPQPDELDSREPPDGHYGLPVRYPNGEERGWYPPAEAPAPRPRTLTPNQVIDLILGEIGATGFAACVRSDLDVMVTWRYKMSVARDITKDQAAAGLSVIATAGLMTADQRAAILANWHTA